MEEPKAFILTVMIMVFMALLFASSIDAKNSTNPFTGNASNVAGEGGGGGGGNDTEEFVLSINISENTLYGGDKDISYFRASLGAPSRPSAFDTRHPLLHVVPGEQDDVHHEINKSNQGNTNPLNRSSPHTSHIRGPGEDVESSKKSTSSASSAYFERVELQESRAAVGAAKDNLLLHRHKRYLVFPEGSSFQLVFDLIIPIVDYTNYAIMGITCAVAWELPSKPPSEIIENFRHKLNDGTFGLIRRHDTVRDQQHQFVTGPGSGEGIFTVDAGKGGNQQKLSATDATSSSAHRTPPRNLYYSNALETSRPESSPEYLYRQQPEDSDSVLGRPLDKDQRKTFYAEVNGWPMHQSSHQTKAGIWWSNNKERIERQYSQDTKEWQTYSARNRKILSKLPKHRIYPVFGKRRKRSYATQSQHHTLTDSDDVANKLHEIHTKEHLHTRHQLYGKIEKLYKTRGHNGTACVLRTLCETHKEHHQHRQRQRQRRSGQPTPRTFVMELLRAIFTLPPDTLATLKPPSLANFIGAPYTEAVQHAHQVPSCSRYYDGCEHPIWGGVEF